MEKKKLKIYSKYINPYIEKILNNDTITKANPIILVYLEILNSEAINNKTSDNKSIPYMPCKNFILTPLILW